MWVIFGVVIIVSATVFVLYRVGSGISASVEHKAAKTASATVVSVAPLQKTDPVAAHNSAELYRVCYTIDNFDQVESDVRQGYRAAEIQRLSRDGPRCKVTSKVALSTNVHVGDKLSIVYLLENQYHIDVVAVSAFGEDF